MKDLIGNSVQYVIALLQLIESLRLAFADTNFYVADPEKAEVPLKGLLRREYARERAALIDKNRGPIQQKQFSLRFYQSC